MSLHYKGTSLHSTRIAGKEKAGTLDAIRGTALPEQNKKKLLILEQEFEQMETEIASLKSENLHHQARVNPLEREVERLKNQIAKTAAHDSDKLDRLSETILVDIANSDRIVREHIYEPANLLREKADTILIFDGEKLYRRCDGASSWSGVRCNSSGQKVFGGP